MWVFGYGSLLWNPGFRYSRKEIARLDGYRRSFSMRSIHHRGTAENPGLVLALSTDRKSFCDGLAFEVAQGKELATLEYLRGRELVSSAYLEKKVSRHLNIYLMQIRAKHLVQQVQHLDRSNPLLSIEK